jgi:hypothetical protein
MTDVNFEKDIDVDLNFDFKTNVNIEKDVDIDVNLKSDVDVHGNFAQIVFSAEATGYNTFAEADVHTLTTDTLSDASGVLTSATN